MGFAVLPAEEQERQIIQALQRILGSNPSQLDYVMLCATTQMVIDGLEDGITNRPFPVWARVVLSA